MQDWMKQQLVHRLALWGNGGAAPPVSLFFDFTRYCPYNCSFCIARPELEKQYAPNYKELPAKLMEKLAYEASKLGVLWWGIAGGEPSVDIERLMALIRAVREQGMRGFLVSNGWGWTDASLRETTLLDWTLITFSVNSHEPAIHDRLLGRKGAFGKIIDTIKKLVTYKREYRKMHPILAVNTIIFRDNFRSLDRLVEYLASLEINHVNFIDLYVFPDSEAQKLALPATCRDEFQEVVERVATISSRYGILTNIDTYRDKRILTEEKVAFCGETQDAFQGTFASVFCFDPWSLMKIDATGQISCCRSRVYPHVYFQEEGDLEKIWYNDRLMQLRRDLLADQLPYECHHCCSPIYAENHELRAMLSSGNQSYLPKTELLTLQPQHTKA